MSTLDALRKNTAYDIKTAANSAWFVLIGKDERMHPEEGKITCKNVIGHFFGCLPEKQHLIGLFVNKEDPFSLTLTDNLNIRCYQY